MVLEIAQRFAAVHRADGLPDSKRNVVRHKSHRAIPEPHIHAVGMPAAGGPVMIGSGRAGHLDYGPRDAEAGQLDVGRRAVGRLDSHVVGADFTIDKYVAAMHLVAL